MSIILLNLLVGPPMFRHALVRVGEAKNILGKGAGAAGTAALMLGLQSNAHAHAHGLKETSSGASLPAGADMEKQEQ